MGSCIGGCCAAFHLPYEYDELERRYHGLRDGGTIFDMVRPITAGEAIERGNREAVADREDDGRWYRCVRWDEQTRLCTRYDERPEMCSDYPYEDACTLAAGCTYREPAHVRFRWLAIRLGCADDGFEWWGGQWHRTINVTALTFPG